MSYETLVALTLLAYGLGAVGALLGGPMLRWLGHCLPLVAGILEIFTGLGSLLSQTPWQASWPSSYPLLTFSLRLDPLAALFLVLLGILSLCTSWFALSYTKHLEAHGHGLKALIFFYNVFLASMALVVLADHALAFLLAWELMALSSYFLVVYEHDRPEHCQAGFLYFVLTHIGTALVLVLFLSLYASSGSLEFAAFRTQGALLDSGLKDVLFVLALLGFGLKAGIIPLHVWLPAAHPAAPSHVSALMSGFMIKLGIYGLLRAVFEWLPPFPMWWGVVALGVGACSAVLGVLYAVLENDLKRLLAYSSIENIGIILLGAGLGMCFQALGLSVFAAFALLSGLLHLTNHALFKGLLFLGSGAVLQATGTRNLEQLGGLLKRMPHTGLLFLIGSMAISALPPLNGFISEWMTFQAFLLSLSVPETVLHLTAPIGGALLALAGALAIGCFVKAFGIAFLGAARSPQAAGAQEVAWSMRGSMALLGLLCLAAGLWPGGVLQLLNPVAQGWTGVSALSAISASGGLVIFPTAWEKATVSPVGLLALASLLGVAVFLAVQGVRRYGRHSWGASWDCGLKQLSPRMQYSATGFSKPIRMVFRTIYRPRRDVEMEHGVSPYFRNRIHYKVSISSPFESYLYRPVSQGVLWLAAQVRRMQTGSLQLYLIYVLLALLAALWVSR